jgi:hypothetical protein
VRYATIRREKGAAAARIEDDLLDRREPSTPPRR